MAKVNGVDNAVLIVQQDHGKGFHVPVWRSRVFKYSTAISGLFSESSRVKRRAIMLCASAIIRFLFQ